MPVYYIWVAHGEGSMSESGYEYGTSSASAISKNLGFRWMVYDLVGLHFEAPPPSSYDHAYANKEPNYDARTFYDLLGEDQQLYSVCDFASPSYTMA